MQEQEHPLGDVKLRKLNELWVNRYPNLTWFEEGHR